MNEYLAQIENEPSYSKDMATGAILTTDNNKLLEYKTRSKLSKQITLLQNEINNLKHELETIKTFLKIS